MESSKPRIVITGISGYLGSHICLLALKDGGFRVRGTVRDPTSEAKIAPLRVAFGELFYELELAKADLLDADSLDRAIEGCDYVIHCASPIPAKPPKDENVLIKPAVDGTLAVLKAARKHKVKRVIYTGSGLAVCMRKPENRKALYTDEDWSDVDIQGAYEKSKTLAERAAWDYVKELPSDEKFELTVILPGFIQGPPLIQSDFSSGEVMKLIMTGGMPGNPKVTFPIVDVRDAALAHILAIKVPEAGNVRFICNSAYLKFKEMSGTLKAHFGTAYPIKTNELGLWLVTIASWFDSSLKLMIKLWDQDFAMDTSKSKNILGMQYHDVSETLVSMAESMIASGQIPERRKK